MGNIVFEKTSGEIAASEESIWDELIEEGLASDRGRLNDDKIRALDSPEPRYMEDKFGWIIGVDTRTEVTDLDVAPYDSVVLLLMKYGSDTYRGTGFMIKDNVVLTAGHNIYSISDKKAADEVYVIKRTNDGSVVYARKHRKLKVSIDYVADKSDDGHYDWGLIMIDPALPEAGTIGVIKASDTLAVHFTGVLIAGYPGQAQGSKTWKMWEAGGKMDYDNASETLKYVISTSKGNSGSPVIIDTAVGKKAVGIHVQGSTVTNTAKAIDDEVIEAINDFR